MGDTTALKKKPEIVKPTTMQAIKTDSITCKKLLGSIPNLFKKANIATASNVEARKATITITIIVT